MEEQVRTAEEVHQEVNEMVKKEVLPESTVKDFFLQLITHQKRKALNDESADVSVSVEDCLEILVSEFPELMTVVAEGNFVLGYQTAFTDMENATEDD